MSVATAPNASACQSGRSNRRHSRNHRPMRRKPNRFVTTFGQFCSAEFATTCTTLAIIADAVSEATKRPRQRSSEVLFWDVPASRSSVAHISSIHLTDRQRTWRP